MSVRDIIEAASPSPWGLYGATVKDSRGEHIASYSEYCALSFADASFIATFDPEHVALMEAVCEAENGGTDAELTEAGATLEAYRKERGL